MKTALILIDIQNDYFPGGKMELEGSEKAGETAGTLLGAFRDEGLPVVHIRHVSTRSDSTFFLPDTDGIKIHPCVAAKKDEPIFTKHFPNAFRDTPLKSHLENMGISRLVFAGMMTHMCVDTSVRAAFDSGFSCILAHDACATRSLTFKDKTATAEQVQLAYLAALNGLFADVRSVKNLCTAFFEKTSGHG